MTQNNRRCAYIKCTAHRYQFFHFQNKNLELYHCLFFDINKRVHLKFKNFQHIHCVVEGDSSFAVNCGFSLFLQQETHNDLWKIKSQWNWFKPVFSCSKPVTFENNETKWRSFKWERNMWATITVNTWLILQLAVVMKTCVSSLLYHFTWQPLGVLIMRRLLKQCNKISKESNSINT